MSAPVFRRLLVPGTLKNFWHDLGVVTNDSMRIAESELSNVGPEKKVQVLELISQWLDITIATFPLHWRAIANLAKPIILQIVSGWIEALYEKYFK